MYYWEILNRDKSELIHRIYTTQKISNCTGDWVRLVEADKKELGIDLTDEQIQEVSKSSFKTYVKKKVTQNFLQHLKYGNTDQCCVDPVDSSLSRKVTSFSVL